MTEEESRHQQAVSSEAEIIVEAIPDSEVELDSHPHYHYFQVWHQLSSSGIIIFLLLIALFN